MKNSHFACRFRWLWSLLLVAMLLPAADVAGQEAGQQIDLRVDTPFYRWDETGLHVPGYATLDIPGAPALPMWSTVVELPPAGQWSVSVQAGPATRLPLDRPLPSVPVPQLDLNAPQPWQDAAELPASVPLVNRPDPAIYGGDARYPAQLAQAGPEQRQQGRRLLLVRAFPFQFDPAGQALLYYPTLRITVAIDPATPVATPAGPALPVERLDDVDGRLRIYTGQRGLYRLTYQDLQGQGVPVASLNPATLAMSYLNQPVDIQVTGAADGRFDPGDLIIFYAQPYVGRYMTRNVYQLSYGGNGAGARMGTRAAGAVAGRSPGDGDDAHGAAGTQQGLPQPLSAAGGRRPLVRQCPVCQQRCAHRLDQLQLRGGRRDRGRAGPGRGAGEPARRHGKCRLSRSVGGGAAEQP
ncbi:MAG: hypothetical protein V9H69_11135 [Anaerolineae bacterium]